MKRIKTIKTIVPGPTVTVTEHTAEEVDEILKKASAAGCRTCGSKEHHHAQLGGEWPNNCFIESCSSCPQPIEKLN